MDLPTVLIKLTGLVLLIWTIRSIVLHIKEKKKTTEEGKKDNQSVTERVLNNILLYLWLVFMLAFSTGMVINN